MTIKYHPTFPQRFGSIQDSRTFCDRFFSWYNNEHHRGGIGLHTPADVHYGHAVATAQARQLDKFRPATGGIDGWVAWIPAPPRPLESSPLKEPG